MEYQMLWKHLTEVMEGLWRNYFPAIEQTARELGAKRRTIGLLLAAVIYEPVPISEPLLQKRNPYQSFHRQLCDAATDGFFVVSPEGKYHLTTAGGHVAEEIIHAAYDAMRAMNLMPSPDLHIYVDLLKRISKACLSSPEPPGKWCIRHSHRLDPGENAPLIIRLDQYLSDLVAYHDDAHLTAWRPLGFDGPTWETFSLINQGKANSITEITTLLTYRDFPETIYTNAIEQLKDDELINTTGTKIGVTTQGEALYKDVEKQTDEYFFAPWKFLTQSDFDILLNLSKILTKSLQ